MLNLTKTINSPLAFIGFFLRKKKYKISILLLITIFLGVVPIIDSIILKNVIDTVEYMLKNNSKMSILNGPYTTHYGGKESIGLGLLTIIFF